MNQLAGLAYLGVESAKLDEWEEFATNVLGCEVERTPAGLNLRVDERESRITVLRSDREALSYIGWEAKDEMAFTNIRREFDNRNVSYRLGTAEENASRYCLGLLITQDPAGNNVEIAYGLRQRHDFVSPQGARFVTGSLGLGHVVLVAPNFDATHDFYTSVLGFRVSDYFRPLPDLPMEFLHCTPATTALRSQTAARRALTNRRRSTSSRSVTPWMLGRRDVPPADSCISCSNSRRSTWWDWGWIELRPQAVRSPSRSAATPTTRCSRSTCGHPRASSLSTGSAAFSSTTTRGLRTCWAGRAFGVTNSPAAARKSDTVTTTATRHSAARRPLGASPTSRGRTARRVFEVERCLADAVTAASDQGFDPRQQP